jgi:hypothetical protein
VSGPEEVERLRNHVEALLKERDSAIRLAGGGDYIETAVKHLLYRAERAEKLAAAERALRVAIAGEGDMFRKTQADVRALMAGRENAREVSRAVDDALAALIEAGGTP